MKYNKTQKRFDLGLGLNFRIVEENGKLAVRSNIPALDMTVLDDDTRTIEDALIDINSIIALTFQSFHLHTENVRDLIKENNIKELL